MDDAMADTLRKVMTEAFGTIVDMMAAIVTASHHDGNLDVTRLRETLEGMASRPDVSSLDRALGERLLVSMP